MSLDAPRERVRAFQHYIEKSNLLELDNVFGQTSTMYSGFPTFYKQFNGTDLESVSGWASKMYWDLSMLYRTSHGINLESVFGWTSDVFGFHHIIQKVEQDYHFMGFI